MTTCLQVVLTVLAAILGIAACALLTSVLVMLLWDFAVTEVFGLSEIRFVHAWALTVLCGLLFHTTATTK